MASDNQQWENRIKVVTIRKEKNLIFCPNKIIKIKFVNVMSTCKRVLEEKRINDSIRTKRNGTLEVQ